MIVMKIAKDLVVEGILKDFLTDMVDYFATKISDCQRWTLMIKDVLDVRDFWKKLHKVEEEKAMKYSLKRLLEAIVDKTINFL